jgi:CheY-like chemotaxis protein
MSRRFHLLGLLLFLGLGAYWCLSNSHENAPTPTPAAAPATDQSTKLSQAEIRSQFEAIEKDKAASLAKLGSAEANTQLRAEAATKTYEARQQLQLARQPYWAKVLSTNWTVYQKLHAQAVASPKGTAPCTICDGRGKMDFCVVCNGNGKCQTCGGTGHMLNGEPCPDCLGNKACYLCSGTGKMACPFCDDGDIYTKSQSPSNVLPIFCQPPATMIATATPQPSRNTDTSRLPQEALERSQAPVNPANLPPPEPAARGGYIVVSAVALILIFGILRLVKQLNALRESIVVRARQAEEDALREKRIFEDPSMKNFFAELQHGLHASAAEFVPDAVAALRTMHRAATETKLDLADASREFFESAPGNFLWLRTCLAEVNRTTDEARRGKLLLELSEEVRPAKVACLVPSLRSFWLLSFALEGFLRQLSRKVADVTPSAIHTVEGALDMLEHLSVAGVRPDLASNPEIRLLAVDDDAVCLRAMSFALKKVFSEPELAPEGATALGLVEQNVYDVIFMDVDMPGMDGFEVCTKIRESQLNKDTPVVFVTRHSDFDSRAKSVLVGGQDLIAKPYLPAEITVKTLMITLRARLDSDAAKAKVSAPENNGDGAQVVSDQSPDASEATAETTASA